MALSFLSMHSTDWTLWDSLACVGNSDGGLRAAGGRRHPPWAVRDLNPRPPGCKPGYLVGVAKCRTIRYDDQRRESMPYAEGDGTHGLDDADGFPDLAGKEVTYRARGG